MSCRMAAGVGRLPWAGLLHGFNLMARNDNERHEYHGRPGREHGGGWGVVTGRAGRAGRVTCYRSTSACWEEPAFEGLYGTEMGFMMLHARRASPGIAVRHEFTHPFEQDGWYFCHNGRVHDFEVGEQSDSQQLFALILENLDRCSDPPEGITRAVASLNGFSALNFILLGKDRLYVLNMYGSRGQMSPKYYTMKYLQTGDYTVISSERLPGLGREWQEMANGSLLTLALRDRRLEISHITF